MIYAASLRVIWILAIASLTAHVVHARTNHDRTRQSEHRSTPTRPLADSPHQTHFLILGKAMPDDHPTQQQRAADAVLRLATPLTRHMPGITVEAIPENVMTTEEYWSGEVEELANRAIFRTQLERLAAVAGPEDTVVIYSHSHGRRSDFEVEQPLGGMVLDFPDAHPDHRGTFLWDEYVEAILAIPAKNVIVLTMSCFSGGLVEYFNTPGIRSRWEGLYREQGRNLVIISSQNKDLPSSPIIKDAEGVNPFTYALAKMLSGHADGFHIDAPEFPLPGDGQLTLGEMIDYVLYTTANLESDNPRLPNSADPRIVGSFNRELLLSFGTKHQNLETAEDTPLNIALNLGDQNPDSLDYSVSTAPDHGSLSGIPPHLVYTPEEHYFGEDQFAFTVTDGIWTTFVCTVKIAVTPVNDPPIIESGPLANPNPAPAGTVVSLFVGVRDSDQTEPAVTWLSGDGATRFGFQIEHTYNCVGTYTASVTVSDGETDVQDSLRVEIDASIPGDLNADGLVNLDDLQLVLNRFGRDAATDGWDGKADVNHDDAINIEDLTAVTADFGQQ